MDGEILPRNSVEPLHQEANELTAIFVASIRTEKSAITNQKWNKPRMDAIEQELKTLLAEGETLTVEFKSDTKGLSGRDLVAAVIAIANTEGGLILLGVEDDGTVTGVNRTIKMLPD